MFTLSETEQSDIRQQFRRCNADTIEAILRFRAQPLAAEIPVIVIGIMERYLRGPAREKLAAATPETPLTDLGIESLTMLEIILDAQDALGLQVADDELRHVRTLGDVQNLLSGKIPPSPAV